MAALCVLNVRILLSAGLMMIREHKTIAPAFRAMCPGGTQTEGSISHTLNLAESNFNPTVLMREILYSVAHPNA